jgi:hypothetical protein
MFRPLKPFAVAALIAGTPLSAANPALPNLLDRDRDNGCALVIADAGKAMLIRASGLVPGESYRFTLTNGDMKPVDFAGYANGEGSLIRYYAPFRFGQPGGVVAVNLAASNCSLTVTAPWTRGVPVIR